MANELIRDPFRSGLEVIQTVRSEMDRLAAQLGLPSLGLGRLQQQQGGLGSIVPTADIIEDDTAYRITLDIPGIDPKEVEVNQIGNQLSIRGERRSQEEQRGRNYILSERSHGTVRRQFAIPDGIDRARINAEFRNGLLTVTLPKSQESRDQTRRIEIKST